MTQDELWNAKWQDTNDFIRRNRRNPSKYVDEERGKYCTWIKHNRKLLNAGRMKKERVEKFVTLLELIAKYKRKNQYE